MMDKFVFLMNKYAFLMDKYALFIDKFAFLMRKYEFIMDKVCIFNISPIDGRYNNLTNELSFLFSEFSFIKQRVIIEIHYSIFGV